MAVFCRHAGQAVSRLRPVRRGPDTMAGLIPVWGPRRAVPTFRRATIADGCGGCHVSSTDEPLRAFYAVDSDRTSCLPDVANFRERPRSGRVA